MIHPQALISLWLIIFPGMFRANSDLTNVPVMEGEFFTLLTGLSEIQSDDEIEWRFGPSRTRITGVADGEITVYEDKRFNDRLQVEKLTGDLTITNVTNEHNGVYQLSVIIQNKKSTKRFAVTVYAPLPVPVIFTDTSRCSERVSGMFMCSVVNVSHVTLSWLQGNSVLSSISVSDLSISLSLPLEVDFQDNNTYSCEINNPIRNQTTHLDISQLCHTSSICDLCFDTTEAVIRLVITALMGVAALTAVVLLVNDIRRVGKAQTNKL